MHVSCVICSDLFVAADDTFCTQCGHLFHYQCLIQWIERSKSCPQCRTKTTEKNIHRVYFNIPSADEKSEDPSVLYNKIDSLTFQIRLKDTDLKTASDKNAILDARISVLKDELITAQSKCKDLEREISALKENIRYLRNQTKEVEQAQKDVTCLKNELELLKSVQLIIKGTSTEVEEMLDNFDGSYESFKRISTYVSILKRELHGSTEKRRKLHAKLKDSEHDLNAALVELNKLKNELSSQVKRNAQLEQDIHHQESENRSLQKKIKELQAAVVSPSVSHPSQSALRRLITESPAPESLKRLKKSQNMLDKTEEFQSQQQIEASCSPSTSKLSVTDKQHNFKFPLEKDIITEVSSPYLKVKSSVVGLTPLKSSMFRRMPSHDKFTLLKKPRIEGPSRIASEEAVYDGHGGHSKPDVFPRPVLFPKSNFKTKAVKRMTVSSLTKAKPVSSNTIRNFLKD